MKILILTQYYLPETGAPQNRLSNLAVNLKKSGNDVEILSALPNYPRYEKFPGYKYKWHCKDIIAGITVNRSYIFVSKRTGVIARLTSYLSFTISAYFSASVRLKKFDVIICESPPLFLGITAVLLKRKWNCKLVFNVSDLWPESVEKMNLITNKWIIGRAYKLANWIYKNADLISGQTKGILEAIRQMQPQKKLFWFPNGVDMDVFKKYTPSKNGTKQSFNILYAGIIGHAQGLEVILHAADILKEQTSIEFCIIGDGPVKENLLSLQKELKLTNVTFIANQPHEKIIEHLQHCDAYVVPLRKLDLFKGAIPSKLFEPLAFGKPILLGVDGEARKLFIDEAQGGLFYEPENARGLANAILQLQNNRE
ncbi:MAG: glycosyltransferase family 4 protein, partial [Panacibacter sp.]